MSDLTAAQDPKTPPDLLEVLAKSSDRAVREAVVGNPNTPQRAREELLLSDPDLFVRICAVRHPSTPLSLLERLADEDPGSHASVAHLHHELVNHPKATPELLMRLATHRHPAVRDLVVQNPNTP